MRYDAVIKYADDKHKLFGKFSLPNVAPVDPSGDAPICVPPRRARLSSRRIFSSPPSVPRARNKRQRREPQHQQVRLAESENSVKTVAVAALADFIRDDKEEEGEMAPGMRRRN